MAKPDYAMEFTRVVARRADDLVLSGHLPALPDVRATRLAEYRAGSWSHLADLPEIVASLATYGGNAAESVLALLRNGVLHSWTGGEHSVEVVDRTRGLFFSEVRQIGSRLFACGAGRQVFRRDRTGWTAVDHGLVIDPVAGRQQAILATRRVLTSLDGHDEGDVFSVGTGGAIVHFDGSRWTRLSSPTNLGLMCVRCYTDGTYTCGFHGLLLTGGHEGWRTIHYRHGAPPFTDMAFFQGQLYVASEFQLFVLHGESLRELHPPLPNAPAFGALAVTGDRLVSVGSETILLFDGEEWEVVECPWNRETAD